MRLRKKKCTPQRLMDLKEHFLDVSEPALMDLKNIFNNNHETHIEIGAGKGKFITTLAQQNPDINYIAFEKSDDIIALAAMKAEGLNNLKFVNIDAEIVDRIFEKHSIGRIYLNFSDPWPKSGQKKRRLTHANFLEKYKTILKKNGEIHFKTDNRRLFEFSILEMKEFHMHFLMTTLDLHKNYPEGNILTEYEERFSSAGIPINKVIATFDYK